MPRMLTMLFVFKRCQKSKRGWAIAPPALTTLSLGLLPIIALANRPGNLNAVQARSLKTVGISVAVPSYIPQQFQVAAITTNPCPPNAKRDSKGNCTSRSGYKILYRNPNQTCFEVYGEFTRGIGGGAGEFAFPVDTKLFGQTWIGFGNKNYDEKKPSSQQLNSPQPNLSSFPVYQAGTAIIYGIRTVEAGNGCGINRNLTPLEVKTILQSFIWLPG